MLCPAIDTPASCEIRAVIRFLHAKNKSAAEIHRELYVVYGQNVMSEETIRYWCRRTHVHDEERSGRLSVVMMLFKVMKKKVLKDGASQFQKFYVNFHKFHG
jgi:hypothetical protein